MIVALSNLACIALILIFCAVVVSMLVGTTPPAQEGDERS